jgi:hypothetical protein
MTLHGNLLLPRRPYGNHEGHEVNHESVFACFVAAAHAAVVVKNVKS